MLSHYTTASSEPSLRLARPFDHQPVIDPDHLSPCAIPPPSPACRRPGRGPEDERARDGGEGLPPISRHGARPGPDASFAEWRHSVVEPPPDACFGTRSVPLNEKAKSARRYAKPNTCRSPCPRRPEFRPKRGLICSFNAIDRRRGVSFGRGFTHMDCENDTKRCHAALFSMAFQPWLSHSVSRWLLVRSARGLSAICCRLLLAEFTRHGDRYD